MQWLNLDMKTLTSAELIGAEPVERATWLFLMRFCAQQENGGVIYNCVSWSDRKWQQLCSITLVEVCIESQLWQWNDSDIHVWAYPAEKEKEVITNRRNGKKGGRPRRKTQTEPPEKPNGLSESKPVGKTQTEPPEKPNGLKSVKRKGIERKGIERNRKEERKVKENQPTFSVIYPKKIDVSEFREVFQNWITWKEKSGDALDELTLQSTFRTIIQQLKVNTLEEIIQAVDTAIAGRWKNLRLQDLKPSKKIEEKNDPENSEVDKWCKNSLAIEN